MKMVKIMWSLIVSCSLLSMCHALLESSGSRSSKEKVKLHGSSDLLGTGFFSDESLIESGGFQGMRRLSHNSEQAKARSHLRMKRQYDSHFNHENFEHIVLDDSETSIEVSNVAQHGKIAINTARPWKMTTPSMKTSVTRTQPAKTGMHNVTLPIKSNVIGGGASGQEALAASGPYIQRVLVREDLTGQGSWAESGHSRQVALEKSVPYKKGTSIRSDPSIQESLVRSDPSSQGKLAGLGLSTQGILPRLGPARQGTLDGSDPSTQETLHRSGPSSPGTLAGSGHSIEGTLTGSDTSTQGSLVRLDFFSQGTLPRSSPTGHGTLARSDLSVQEKLARSDPSGQGTLVGSSSSRQRSLSGSGLSNHGTLDESRLSSQGTLAGSGPSTHRTLDGSGSSSQETSAGANLSGQGILTESDLSMQGTLDGSESSNQETSARLGLYEQERLLKSGRSTQETHSELRSTSQEIVARSSSSGQGSLAGMDLSGQEGVAKLTFAGSDVLLLSNTNISDDTQPEEGRKGNKAHVSGAGYSASNQKVDSEMIEQNAMASSAIAREGSSETSSLEFSANESSDMKTSYRNSQDEVEGFIKNIDTSGSHGQASEGAYDNTKVSGARLGGQTLDSSKSFSASDSRGGRGGSGDIGGLIAHSWPSDHKSQSGARSSGGGAGTVPGSSHAGTLDSAVTLVVVSDTAIAGTAGEMNPTPGGKDVKHDVGDASITEGPRPDATNPRVGTMKKDIPDGGKRVSSIIDVPRKDDTHRTGMVVNLGTSSKPSVTGSDVPKAAGDVDIGSVPETLTQFANARGTEAGGISHGQDFLNKDLIDQKALLGDLLLKDQHDFWMRKLLLYYLMGNAKHEEGFLLNEAGPLALESFPEKRPLAVLGSDGIPAKINEGKQKSWFKILDLEIIQASWKVNNFSEFLMNFQVRLTLSFPWPFRFLTGSTIDVNIVAPFELSYNSMGESILVVSNCNAFFNGFRIQIKGGLLFSLMGGMMTEALQKALPVMLCPVVRFWFVVINQELHTMNNVPSTGLLGNLNSALTKMRLSAGYSYELDFKGKFFPDVFNNWLLQVSGGKEHRKYSSHHGRLLRSG